MSFPPIRPIAFAAAAIVAAAPALAADIQPHRALYVLTLGNSKTSSGVLGADGAMTYEWGETCGGWTVEQRFRLRLEYADQDATEITSNLVTWELKDGSRYRFNETRMRNGELDQQIKGEAHLNIPQSLSPRLRRDQRQTRPTRRAPPSRRPPPPRSASPISTSWS